MSIGWRGHFVNGIRGGDGFGDFKKRVFGFGKDVKAELVESLENKLELDDDHLLEEDDIGRLLVGVTVNVGTESLVGLLGTSVLGETSIWMLKGN